MRLRVILALLSVLVGLTALPTPALADPQEDLALAEASFQADRFDEAADILGKLLAVPIDPDDPTSKQREVVYLQARPLYAACLVALGRVTEADRVILSQYRANPFYEIAPGQFPQPVVERFIKVQTENRTKIEAWKKAVRDEQRKSAARRAEIERRRAERLAVLEAMAAEERTVVTRNRWVAAVPFGVGQFQNDNLPLGIFFAAGTTAGITMSVVSFVVAENIAESCPTRDDCDVEDAETRFNAWRITNWVSLGATAAFVVGGIIEAQVSFQDEEVEVRERDIPPPVEITPDAVVTDQGAWFGLRGRF